MVDRIRIVYFRRWIWTTFSSWLNNCRYHFLPKHNVRGWVVLMMTSFCCWWLFTNRFKHFKADWESVWTAKWIILTEKKNSFDSIPWNNLGQPVHFLSKPQNLRAALLKFWFHIFSFSSIGCLIKAKDPN